MADGRKPPDYNVSAVVRGTEIKGGVGVAWKQDDGRISVKLHAFVVLTAGPDLFISLFPRSDEPRKDEAEGPRTRPGARRRESGPGGRGNADMDDDIPF